MAHFTKHLPRKTSKGFIDGFVLYEDSLGGSGAICCQDTNNWYSKGDYKLLAETETWYKRGMRYHKPCYCSVCQQRVNGFDVFSTNANTK